MKPGRNDPCPCGSGKKYKQCCLAKSLAQAESPAELAWRRIRRANDELIPKMVAFVADTYGESAIDEAWDEFMLWDDDEYEDWVDSPQQSVFLPWMLHSWSPDPHDDTVVADESLLGVPPTRAFLDRNAKRLDSVTQRYLEACLVAPFTFYEILKVERDHHFHARELMSGQEHLVLERSATHVMQKGAILFGALAQVDGIVMLEGCAPVVIPPIHKLPLIEARKKLCAGGDPPTEQSLTEWDIELRTLYLSIADGILYSTMPELRNTDGDMLSLQRLIFDIDSPQEAFDGLKHLALDVSDEELLMHAQRATDGTLQRVEFQWLKHGNQQHETWNSTTLGAIEIDQRRLSVHVNSDERAAEFKRIVEESLGSRARFRVREMQSLKRSLEEGERSSRSYLSEQEDLAKRPEVQAALREMMSKHYDGWLNEKLPALKGKTPLEAVEHADGREMVEALVRNIEMDGQKMTPPLDDAIPKRLRERLGLRS